MRTLKIQSSTNKCVFRYRQSNVRRLLPASDYCRALFRCLNWAQRFDYCALSVLSLYRIESNRIESTSTCIETTCIGTTGHLFQNSQKRLPQKKVPAKLLHNESKMWLSNTDYKISSIRKNKLLLRDFPFDLPFTKRSLTVSVHLSSQNNFDLSVGETT